MGVANLGPGEIKTGRIYRAKNPRCRLLNILSSDFYYDDRQVLHVSRFGEVQYDSPFIKLGHPYRKTTMEKFVKWAGKDVTDTTPTGEWNKREVK